MAKIGKKQIQQSASKPNSALKKLNALVGEWKMEAMKEQFKLEGQTTFQWFEDGAFLLQRSDFKPAELPPAATMIIGGDESSETFGVLYYDSRGVPRILQMSLTDGVWKLWRDAPGFSQRFTGTFSKDGNVITGRWEKSLDGSNWENDFDLTYTKVKSSITGKK
ncbi:MAG: hypothetical protein M1282_08340 [Chloroflexi bacterium]|nr:hypothetical protein [Chloroflexota bacterium]